VLLAARHQAKQKRHEKFLMPLYCAPLLTLAKVTSFSLTAPPFP
jgi:hypothetical protein